MKKQCIKFTGAVRCSRDARAHDDYCDLHSYLYSDPLKKAPVVEIKPKSSPWSFLKKLKWWHTHQWTRWSDPVDGNIKYTVSRNNGPYFPRTIPVLAQTRTCRECNKVEMRVQDCFGNPVTSAQSVMERER